MKILANHLKNMIFVEEWPRFCGDKLPIRIYYTKKSDYKSSFLWLVGFPKEMVEPISLLLETTLYWGNKHMAEDGDFWIYWAGIASDTSEVPGKELMGKMAFWFSTAPRCLAVMEKMASSSQARTLARFSTKNKS